MGSLPRGDCRSNYENGQEVGRMRETEEGLTIRAFSLSPSKGQPDSNIRKVVNLRHRITLRRGGLTGVYSLPEEHRPQGCFGVRFLVGQ